eukprot:XP_014057862.1 PREDICTED: uncharacterized protein LOC106606238 isoform X2 [Salmo salar]
MGGESQHSNLVFILLMTTGLHVDLTPDLVVDSERAVLTCGSYFIRENPTYTWYRDTTFDLYQQGQGYGQLPGTRPGRQGGCRQLLLCGERQRGFPWSGSDPCSGIHQWINTPGTRRMKNGQGSQKQDQGRVTSSLTSAMRTVGSTSVRLRINTDHLTLHSQYSREVTCPQYEERPRAPSDY